jgi:hypothetical protein
VIRRRRNILDLMTVVLFASIALGGVRMFWDPGSTNYEVYFAAYLAGLSTSTLGSRLARGRWRRFWQGYALFGWIYLAFVLHGGFGIRTIYDAQAMAKHAPMGMVIGLLGAIAATWLPPPEWSGQEDDEQPERPETKG